MFMERIDANFRSYFILLCAGQWFGMQLSHIVTVITLVTAILSVVLRHTIDPSAAALSITYCIIVTNLFQWAVRQSAEAENLMTNTERIHEYGELVPESNENNSKTKVLVQPPDDWCSRGIIEFKDYRFRYRPELDPALKSINLRVESKEKIGVIGRTVDKNEQIDLDMSFHLEDLKVNDPSDMMNIEEKSSSENYEIIDSNSRKILDQFLLVLDLNNTTNTDQISSQAQVINDVIEKAPFITMQNKDRFVRLELETEYSVQAFDSVYARTSTTTDGNCLYSSLSILNIGSEKLTHSMRLLAVNAMINNSDYFRTLCKSLAYSFEEQLKRTAKHKIWGGEVHIQTLSIALSHPIYSYTRFNNNPENRHYLPPNISLEELIDRFNEWTAGGRLKYIGYKSDMNKLGLCVYYNGIHYDALLPFEDNPQQFVPHFDIINMSL
ncbi:unnamed protein product [Rotaria sp. Silwood1]|nr:unnamed protein product [Rotaria sp. Silwood1]